MKAIFFMMNFVKGQRAINITHFVDKPGDEVRMRSWLTRLVDGLS